MLSLISRNQILCVKTSSSSLHNVQKKILPFINIFLGRSLIIQAPAMNWLVVNLSSRPSTYHPGK